MDERKIIDRRLLADLAKEVGLNASHLEALGESRHWEIVIDGDMLERLVEIQHRFERLAAMGDDEYRGFYIEVPRPTPEEWGDVEELIAFGEYDSREAFLADWLAFNPMEASWFHVASSRYGDSRSIRVTDRKRTRFIITNRSKCADAEPDDTWCRENLTRLFDYLQRMIDVVLESMTIRKYCTYYRIANEVYEAYHRKSGLSERIYIDPQDVPEELRDVAYYKRKKFVDVTEMYDIDSPEDFMRFATDHYGELGLSRLNVFASNDRQHGWMIVVSNSYSSNVGLAIEVATALYKAGAPLLIYDAEKLLRILLEEDYVRLVPDSYHNYLGYQEEGSVYELPWEYECSDDTNSVLTKEQYQAIVSLAEWQEVEKIKVP